MALIDGVSGIAVYRLLHRLRQYLLRQPLRSNVALTNDGLTTQKAFIPARLKPFCISLLALKSARQAASIFITAPQAVQEQTTD
jgi:hypothetical protein